MGPNAYKHLEDIREDQKVIYQSADERIKITDDGYYKRYYLDNKLHRDGDLPAIEGGYTKVYYQFGKIHRENNQPAYINGPQKGYYINGLLHRQDKGPAFSATIDCRVFSYYGQTVTRSGSRKINKRIRNGEIPSCAVFPKQTLEDLEKVSLNTNFNKTNLFLLYILEQEKLALDLRIKKLERTLELFRTLPETITETIGQHRIQVEEEQVSLNQIIQTHGFEQRISSLYANFDYSDDYSYKTAEEALSEIYEYRNNFLNKIMEFISLPQYAFPNSNKLTELEPYMLSTVSSPIKRMLESQTRNKNIEYGINPNSQRLEIQFLDENNKIDEEKHIFYTAFSELLDNQNIKSIIETIQEHSHHILSLNQQVEENIALCNSEIETVLNEISQELQAIMAQHEDNDEKVQTYKKQLLQYL